MLQVVVDQVVVAAAGVVRQQVLKAAFYWFEGAVEVHVLVDPTLQDGPNGVAARRTHCVA
jgi:hypothetical protein